MSFVSYSLDRTWGACRSLGGGFLGIGDERTADKYLIGRERNFAVIRYPLLKPRAQAAQRRDCVVVMCVQRKSRM